MIASVVFDFFLKKKNWLWVSLVVSTYSKHAGTVKIETNTNLRTSISLYNHHISVFRYAGRVSLSSYVSFICLTALMSPTQGLIVPFRRKARLTFLVVYKIN